MITTKLSQSKFKNKQTNKIRQHIPWEWNVNHICALSYSPLSPVIPLSKYNICPSLHSMDFNYYIFLNVNSLFPSVVFWWIALFWQPFVLSLDRCLLLVRCLEKKNFFFKSVLLKQTVFLLLDSPLKPLNLLPTVGSSDSPDLRH